MFQNLFEISINILEMFIVLFFLSKYFGYRHLAVKRYLGFILALIAAVCGLTIMNFHFVYEGLIGLILVGIYFLYSLLCLKGNPFFQLFVAGFIHCIIYLIALCVFLIVSIAGQYDSVALFLDLDIGRFIWVISSKIMLVIICWFMFKHKPDPYIRLNSIGVLLLIPLMSVVVISNMMNAVFQDSSVRLLMLMGTIGVMLLNILIYYVLIRTNRNDIVKIEKELLLQEYNKKIDIDEIVKLYSNDD